MLQHNPLQEEPVYKNAYTAANVTLPFAELFTKGEGNPYFLSFLHRSYPVEEKSHLVQCTFRRVISVAQSLLCSTCM